MFGIDLIIAAFAAMVWWQIIALGFLVIACGFSLYEENALGILTILAVGIVVFWTMISTSILSLSISGILGFLVIYLGIGVLWSFLKYRIVVSEIVENIKTDKFALKHNTLRDLTKKSVKNNVDNNRISFWILCWPFSIIGYIVNDFIYNMIKEIKKNVLKLINKIKFIYDKITDSIISKYE